MGVAHVSAAEMLADMMTSVTVFHEVGGGAQIVLRKIDINF
jgi:hypothetical protein